MAICRAVTETWYPIEVPGHTGGDAPILRRLQHPAGLAGEVDAGLRPWPKATMNSCSRWAPSISPSRIVPRFEEWATISVTVRKSPCSVKSWNTVSRISMLSGISRTVSGSTRPASRAAATVTSFWVEPGSKRSVTARLRTWLGERATPGRRDRTRAGSPWPAPRRSPASSTTTDPDGGPGSLHGLRPEPAAAAYWMEVRRVSTRSLPGSAGVTEYSPWGMVRPAGIPLHPQLPRGAGQFRPRSPAPAPRGPALVSGCTKPDHLGGERPGRDRPAWARPGSRCPGGRRPRTSSASAGSSCRAT